MKKSKNLWRVLSYVLAVIAVMSGGGAMAVGTIENPNPDNMQQADPAADHESVDADANTRQTPGGDSAGQDLTGTQASATQMREGGLEEDIREEKITQLRPYKNPLLRILSRVSKTQTVNGYRIMHARVGGETLDGVITQAIAAGTTIKLTKNNFSGNLLVFRKYDLICVPSMGGFKDGSQTEHNGEFLVLEVVERDKTGLTLQAINGPAAVEGQTGDEYDYRTVPALAANTYVLGMWNAMSESQLLVTPDNFQPREREVFLQKHGWNVTFTEDFETMKKKYPVKVANLLEDASIKDDMRVERGYWFSPKAKRKRMHEDGAVEDVFYSEGIFTQIPNHYAIGNEYTPSDLIALLKLQFTDFATSNRAFAFCGKNAVERLENINWKDSGRQVTMDVKTEYDLTFKRIKDTFGEINFIWDQTFDFMGMEDYMCILDMDNAVHYIKEATRSRTNDMSKGAGDIRLAKTHWEYDTDAIALKGYNSIVVGPEGGIFNMMTQGVVGYIVSAAVLPETPAKNMKIALTADYKVDNTTYEKGSVYIYNGTAWESYTGADIAA
ncbi:MAG: hypothetical protein IJT48_12075 [Bacteroidaceae bacterium]|nr:hypothetical protein [Bacteroidaceae bacterium]